MKKSLEHAAINAESGILGRKGAKDVVRRGILSMRQNFCCHMSPEKKTVERGWMSSPDMKKNAVEVSVC